MARDTHHAAVKSALIKDGWRITDDPLHVRQGALDLYIDMGAERLLAAERGGERIAVEVKSFIGSSDIADFYTALGQYLAYAQALERTQRDRRLFLAVPLDTWTSFFSIAFIQDLLAAHKVWMIVCNTDTQEIDQWIRL